MSSFIKTRNNLLHGGEVEPIMRKEGECELKAGVEEEVDKVDEALCLQILVILRREVAQGREPEQ